MSHAQMSRLRCGTPAGWSRPSAYAAPCTSSPRTSYRSGWRRCGRPQRTQVTFVRPDQWLRDGVSRHAPVPGEALVEVFRRYLSAYGPATARDFAQWFYLPPRAARDLATSLGNELQEVDVEGYRSYVLAEDASDSGDGGADEVLEHLPVRLLPHFDCYAIGCYPRKRLLPATWGERVPPRTTPSQLPLLLVDGIVAGVSPRATKG